MGSLSLEFASRETNGLLLYGGPTTPVENGDVYDFITVELWGGKILVSMSLGDPDDVVRLGVTSGTALNDGEWHHVEVFRDKTVTTFLLFLCVFFCFFGLFNFLFSLSSFCNTEPRGGEQITCERNTSMQHKRLECVILYSYVAGKFSTSLVHALFAYLKVT